MPSSGEMAAWTDAQPRDSLEPVDQDTRVDTPPSSSETRKRKSSSSKPDQAKTDANEGDAELKKTAARTSKPSTRSGAKPGEAKATSRGRSDEKKVKGPGSGKDPGSKRPKTSDPNEPAKSAKSSASGAKPADAKGSRVAKEPAGNPKEPVDPAKICPRKAPGSDLQKHARQSARAVRTEMEQAQAAAKKAKPQSPPKATATCRWSWWDSKWWFDNGTGWTEYVQDAHDKAAAVAALSRKQTKESHPGHGDSWDEPEEELSDGQVEKRKGHYTRFMHSLKSWKPSAISQQYTTVFVNWFLCAQAEPLLNASRRPTAKHERAHPSCAERRETASSTLRNIIPENIDLLEVERSNILV